MLNKIQWGEWSLSTSQTRIPTLDHRVNGTDHVYWIPLPIKTEAQIENWVEQVKEKTWASPLTVRDLREALNEVRGMSRKELDAIHTPPAADEADEDDEDFN